MKMRARLWIVQSSSCYAFAFGNNKGGTVVVTQGLLGSLSTEELKGVLSHELTHIKYGDHSIMTWANSLVRIYKKFLPAYLILSLLAIQRDYAIGVGNPVWLAVHTLATIVMLFVIPTLIVDSLSRTREFVADSAAYSITKEFPSALRKSAINFLPLAGNERLSLLPSTRSLKSIRWFDTHPSLRDRMKRMRDGTVPASFGLYDYVAIGAIVAVSTVLLNEAVPSSIQYVFGLIPSVFPIRIQTMLRIWFALDLWSENSIYAIEILIPAVILLIAFPFSKFRSLRTTLIQSLAVCVGLLCIPLFYLLPEQAISLGRFPIPKRIWPSEVGAFSSLLYSAFLYFLVICAIFAIEQILVAVVKTRINDNRKS
jgi:hypothetical protein